VYACICTAVTDAVVTEAIEAGARTPDAIGRATSAGTSCGSCHEHLCAMIRTLTEGRTDAAPAAS
jgi:bacterioferritin-associated ferredoxin